MWFATCLQCRRWRPWRRWLTALESAAPQWWTRTARRFEGSPGGHAHVHTQLILIYSSHDEAISCPGCYSRFIHVLFSERTAPLWRRALAKKIPSLSHQWPALFCYRLTTRWAQMLVLTFVHVPVKHGRCSLPEAPAETGSRHWRSSGTAQKGSAVGRWRSCTLRSWWRWSGQKKSKYV